MPMSLAEIEALLTAPGQPFEMEDVTVSGLKLRAWKNAPRTLTDIFLNSLQYDDRDFIVYEQDRMTYRQHHDQVVALAHALVDDYGVAKGDRVAIGIRRCRCIKRYVLRRRSPSSTGSFPANRG